MSSSFDFNINNYTPLELFGVLNIDEDTATQQDIIDKTNAYIAKYTRDGNKRFIDFFTNMQDKLLDYIDSEDEEEEDDPEVFIQEKEKDSDKELDKDNLEQPEQHPITDQHAPDTSTNFNVGVKKDKLNPNLKNVTSRLVYLDSQFRQASGSESSTDFTLDLSDPLTNLLSLKLYSVQIPYSWYIIDSQYNNNTFWISTPSVNYQIVIDSGNYTPATLVTELNLQFQAITNDLSGTYVSYNTNNGKLSMDLSGSFLGNVDNYFTFFDFYNVLDTAQTVNNTLGWLMGYRDASMNVIVGGGGNVATCILDLYGSKSFFLVIDDYNQNHLNDGLITITETSSILSLPTYYRPDLPYTIIPPGPIEINNNLVNYADNVNITYRNIPNMLPTSPRILTQAQIYTINEIMKNREKTISYRTRAPTSSDTFAVIPIKHGGLKMGDVYVEFGGTMQLNQRNYFGPVNIERMRVKLLDDKGNVVNLNGVEWSFTLIAEMLYQY